MSYGRGGHSEVGRTLVEGLRRTDLHTFGVLHFINCDFSGFFAFISSSFKNKIKVT